MKRLQKRERERIVWKPVWGKEHSNWASSFNHENKWRCDSMLGHDDLMQESWIIFDKLTFTYPRVIEPKHFFALFKRSMVNKMHDRSCAKRRKDAVQAVLPADVADFFIGRIGETSNAGYLGALLNEAPEELRLVLEHLAKNGCRDNKRRSRFEPRENLSMKLCRSLGLPLDVDPLADLKRLLTT